MPVLISLVACWLAGLTLSSLRGSGAAGARFEGAAISIVCVAVLLPLARELTDRKTRGAASVRTAALLAVFVAALFVGSASHRSKSACAGAMARLHDFVIAIDERIAPGSRVTGIATVSDSALGACAIATSLRVVDGRAPPGALVRVSGSARVTERGLLVEGSVQATGGFEHLRAWRGRTGEIIDTLFAGNAPLVRALLIADQDGIEPAVRDRFADAGLVHMLSISGLHVAIIAGALLVLASAARLPRGWAAAIAMVVITLYVLMIGAPAPAVRSAVMLATLSLSENLQRPVHPWTALALGAAIPTVQPAVVLDLGYQLSVGGMASLVAARALLRSLRLRPHAGNTRRSRSRYHLRSHRMLRDVHQWVCDLRGWRWTLVRELLTGVIATAVTAPLIAWTFGRVSIIAPLSNIVAGPVVAFIQPALFLAIVLAPWHTGASLVADAAAAPLALLDRIAAFSAAVPHASLHVAPTLLGAVCTGVASAAFVRATAARRMLPGMIVAGAALAGAVWAPLLTPGAGTMELHMLDVGQGDALAVRTPRGRWIIVDAGRRWDGGDAGRRTVVPYVRRLGGDVAAFVMSHAHDDHVGGAASVVTSLAPREWWEPAFVSTSIGYRAALLAVQQSRTRWKRVRPGDALHIDGVTMQVIAPDSAWTSAQTDANETSVVVRIVYGHVSFLLTGDAEAEEEGWMLQHAQRDALQADVLKLGHHGSRTSSTPSFLDAVAPRLALISVGIDNRYGHPSPEVVAELAQRQIPVLRTDRDGPIVVSTDGTSISARAGRDRWTVPRR